jgi:glycosyltransferase involved in cell wall biosynthesis
MSPRAGRPRIAVIHPYLLESGGSEAIALWTAQALRTEFDVHLISMGETSIEALNRWHGTTLSEDEIRIIRLPIPRWLGGRFDAFRSYPLARWCRRHAAEFEAMVVAYNIADYGRPALQYISDFSFDDRLRRASMDSPEGRRAILYRASPARALYIGLGRRLTGSGGSRWRGFPTLANSAWTAAIMKTSLGMDCRVVYPPVAAVGPGRPWDKRRDAFMTIGRLSPEKRIETMIRIVDEVRSRGLALPLDIYGPRTSSSYGRTIAAMCDERNGACGLKGILSGADKISALGTYKYGLSGRLREPFGISVAEMVKAGALVWVPSGGGQVEIVDHPDLIYDNAADAAAKIESVLRDPERLAALRAHLARQAEKFSAERFMTEMRNAVGGFLETHASRT